MFEKLRYSSYNEFYDTFKWNVPKNFNIGYECSDYHCNIGNGDKIALIDHTVNKNYTFNDISTLSNKLSISLKEKFGIQKGDRISILLPQSLENGISHLSTFKLGAISLPLFILFGHDALKYRLSDSASKIIITNQECLPKILEMKSELPHLQHILVTGDYTNNDNNCYSFNSLLDVDQYSSFKYENTLSDDEALIIYTSGTTGSPKGCLHAHRVLLGHLPGIETPHNLVISNPDSDNVFWTPADWAWIGGLLDALLPSWYYGIPIVAYRARKFDVKESFDLMKKYNVTGTFLPPTALKYMKSVIENDTDNTYDYKHKLKSVGSGGESLGSSLLEWAKKTFDTEINEFYGQTECNLVVSNSNTIFDIKSGSMGRPVPGHIVDILDNDGNILKNNETGNICIKYPDPVMFLNYWNLPEKTEKKFVTNKQDGSKWLMTGDLGCKDDDGYFYYNSRDDDVINCKGYRIGPDQIEIPIESHDYVANCIAIGIVDENDIEVIKVFVTFSDIAKDNIDNIDLDKLGFELKELVRDSQGHYCVPNYIEFVDELAMTITGKKQRNVHRNMEKNKLNVK